MSAATPRDVQGARTRLFELDALRGAAALAVLAYHYTTRYDELYGYGSNLDLPAIAAGQYGVQLFFIISGYVIYMTALRSRGAWQFAFARASRLYPVYWAAGAITFTVVAVADLPGRAVSIAEAIANMTMVQGLLGVPDVDSAYWSLLVELVFYAIVFLLVLLHRLQRLERIAAWWLCGILAAATFERLAATQLPGALSTVLLLEYGQLFIAGMLLRTVHTRGPNRSRTVLLLGCVLAHALVWSLTSAVGIAAFVALVHLGASQRLPLLASRPMVFLGGISYALYLIHQNVGYVVIRESTRRGIDPDAAIVLAASAAVVLATALTYLVERPALRALRSAVGDTRRRAPAGVAPSAP